jgi:hypothetical protein
MVDVWTKFVAACVSVMLTLMAAIALMYVGAMVNGRPVVALGPACRPMEEWAADYFGLVQPFCVDTK